MKSFVRCSNKRHTAEAFLLTILCGLLLWSIDLAAAGVSRGLSLCFETLFPSLFPFLILSELMAVRRVGDLLKGAISRPVSWLFGISGQGSSALLMGALCGAPVGAVTANALYKQGSITREELGRLMLFINNPSAGFLVGAVGGAMLGNARAGVALFSITWLSTAAVGIGIRLMAGAISASITEQSAPSLPPPSIGDLTGSVTRAFFTLLRIFAFVIFFSCISACLSAAIAAGGLPNVFGVLLCGLSELTAGVTAAVSHLSPSAAFCFVAFFSGFSGLSICLQVFSVIEEERFSILPYLLAKGAQGVIALLLARAYLYFFEPVLNPTECLATFAQNPLERNLLIIISTLVFCLLAAGTACKKGGGKARRPLE